MKVSHWYTSRGSKIKVICQGQGQKQRKKKMMIMWALVFHEHSLFQLDFLFYVKWGYFYKHTQWKTFLKFKFKHIYFTSIEKQVLTTYTNLLILLPRNYTSTHAECVGKWKILKFRPAPRTQTRDLMIARPTLYLTTTDNKIACL